MPERPIVEGGAKRLRTGPIRGIIQDLGYELPRITILSISVNKPEICVAIITDSSQSLHCAQRSSEELGYNRRIEGVELHGRPIAS
jgi:hypothetical protein